MPPQDRPLAIVDLDGVVADVRHRLHHIEGRPKRWKAFFDAAVDDEVHPEGAAVVERLRDDHDIVYLTGRPRWLEPATRAWLDQHGLGGHPVVMRPDDDRRPAAVVKVELLRQLADGRRVGVVVDDDERVLAAMADAGFPTFHATWERRALAEQRALEAAQEQEGRT